ncbi:SPOSA6832_02891 [Sporobolomyces salmonicolor]|uniref:SPOSA6832_02891-mRNA-1:cds n=1 Tax=Sporidiobolus salmonicolor TaxID=5005 RepID=A0A0D6EMU5_SPOSA|nr:SPOSA6832_02891 [Sporobolomyces salmonicolor]
MAPRVVLTRYLDPAPLQGAAILDQAHTEGKIELARWQESTAPGREWLLENVKGVEGVVCQLGDTMHRQLGRRVTGPSLRVVSTMSAGYDHVDTAALAKRGIRLGTTPDALTDATADIGAMLALMASRRAGEGIRAVVDGKWPTMPWDPLLLCGRSLQGATVGVLGFGKIGQLTLKRLLGFSISRVLYTTSQPGVALPPSKDYFSLASACAALSIPLAPAESLEHLARESDFLIITCALTPETRGLVDADFLARMKPTAYVINTARGPVVDSDALVAAVQAGQLAGAGLDVVDGEPNLGAEHPLVQEQRIVVLPHIGSATVETRSEMSRQAAVNCLAGVGVDGFEWANEVKLT